MFSFGMTQTGLAHRSEGCGCQDAVHTAKYGTVSAMCLCDGAGSYAYVREGANEQAKAMSRLMARRFFEFFDQPDDVVALEFTIAIKEQLRALHERYRIDDETAFASTVICAGFDAGTRRFLLVHLGDGMAAAVENGEARLLTHVRPGETRATQLTINIPTVILNSMRVSRGTADSLVISSDGAEGCLYEQEGGISESVAQMSLMLRSLPNPHFRSNIEHAVAEAEFDDDFSIGILSWGAPDLNDLGYRHDQSPRDCRIRKAFIAFAQALDSGMPPEQAARRAGWGRKNRAEKLRKAKEMHLA